MATAATNTPMQTFILSFNPKDKRAAKFMETIKLMDFFKVEESPYNPEFVAKIQRSEKSKKHFVDVATLPKISNIKGI